MKKQGSNTEATIMYLKEVEGEWKVANDEFATHKIRNAMKKRTPCAMKVQNQKEYLVY